MERLNKLLSVLRYVGLNINPAILEVVLTLDEKISKGGLSLDDIDALVADIQAKYPAEAPDDAPAKTKK
tara:strand:+ start:476 stop:682 length:207 start_codon:yes stop_codon:yes gene_type:complete